jgi:hypothetical protein
MAGPEQTVASGGGVHSGEAMCCPVCQAKFRNNRTCSRCGTDLSPLMALAARAYALRRSAAGALRAGDLAHARELADQAQTVCATPQGARLLAVASILARPCDGASHNQADEFSTPWGNRCYGHGRI